MYEINSWSVGHSRSNIAAGMQMCIYSVGRLLLASSDMCSRALSCRFSFSGSLLPESGSGRPRSTSLALHGNNIHSICVYVRTLMLALLPSMSYCANGSGRIVFAGCKTPLSPIFNVLAHYYHKCNGSGQTIFASVWMVSIINDCTFFVSM